MKYRDVIKALGGIGATFVRDKGDHTIYGCECGQHIAAVPRHKEVSAGVIGNIIKHMECAPKGWLQ